jgi:CRISPR type I-E-associated protein CasB/Cse2
MTKYELSDAERVVRVLLEHCSTSPKQRASLRRSQGRTLAEAKDVLWFRHLLAHLRREATSENRLNDELIFFVATLLAGDRAVLKNFSLSETLGDVPSNLGASLNEVERKQDQEAWNKKMSLKPDPQRRESRFERRLRLLLDAELTRDGQGDLPFRLRQCVQFVLSGDVKISWEQLLYDLWRWNWQNRPARREWAQAFYGDPQWLKKSQKENELESPIELETDIEA